MECNKRRRWLWLFSKQPVTSGYKRTSLQSREIFERYYRRSAHRVCDEGRYCLQKRRAMRGSLTRQPPNLDFDFKESNCLSWGSVLVGLPDLLIHNDKVGLLGNLGNCQRSSQAIDSSRHAPAANARPPQGKIARNLQRENLEGLRFSPIGKC